MSRMTLALACAFTIAVLAPAAGQDAKTFEGKFVSIQKKSNPTNSVDLEKVELKTLGGRTFLVGTGADTPDNWQKGRPVWVALDDVSEVTVFDTLEELKKAGITQDNPKKDGER